MQTLQARVRYLQRLVQLKDERVAQLTHRLDRLAQVLNDQVHAAIDPAVAQAQHDQQQTAAANQLLTQLMQLRSSLTPSNASDAEDM